MGVQSRRGMPSWGHLFVGTQKEGGQRGQDDCAGAGKPPSRGLPFPPTYEMGLSAETKMTGTLAGDLQEREGLGTCPGDSERD